jgi:DNA-binding NarL/FixJ family response regulator
VVNSTPPLVEVFLVLPSGSILSAGRQPRGLDGFKDECSRIHRSAEAAQLMNSTTYDSKFFDVHVQETSINLAIADDYPVLLAGMRQALAPCDDIVVVAECTRIADLLAQVSLKKPEVVLLGCETDVDSLAQHLHGLAERLTDVKVIVFTGNASLDFHEVALRNGARGVLLKQCAPQLIAETVRKVSLGELCFDRALTHRMLSTFVRRKRTEPLPEKPKIATLTGRESQVMSRICEGLRNKEIASKLYISDATVAHHLTSIYRKLGLADRTELLLYAHQNDISSLRAS